MLTGTIRTICTLVILGGISFSLDSNALQFTARSTSYYPHNSRREGGFKDRMGRGLHTLQAYLAGKAPYVSVAMDSKAFRYGTKLRIVELEKFYGRKIEFRVVDTGGAFKRRGTGRIDICTDSRRSTLHPMVNRRLTVSTDMGSLGASRVVATTPVKTKTRTQARKSVPVQTPVETSSDLKALMRTSLLENREVLNSNPKDMHKYCPQYANLSQQERADVWSEIILSMAQSSSNMNSKKVRTEGIKDANGNFVVSRGLLQISAESARGYKCDISHGTELQNDSANIKCGIKIMQKLIARDTEVGSSNRRGLARYWGTFREPGNVSKLQARVATVASCSGSAGNRVASSNSTGGAQ